MNWLAILCAGAAYWVLGFVWYSLLFGGIWRAEQERHRREISGPAKRELAGMIIASLVSNLVASAAIAYLLHRTGTRDLQHALKLGGGLAAGIPATKTKPTRPPKEVMRVCARRKTARIASRNSVANSTVNNLPNASGRVPAG